ncbi:hypothetical protein LTR64_001211 [Lithohypha guttulata]|uniref:uncharacterized protein n=1 Tax=Lithohypha guttulata TaxID=1690604 RepID=UPI002DE15F19|nr:hypothetical protein LTR51_003405 [Lithohypha guttulata]
MDPISITAACVGLLSGLTAISTKIRNLTVDAKNRNKEVLALHSELDSFQRSLGLFYGSGQADRYPEHLCADLEKIIRGSRYVVEEIDGLLEKVAGTGLTQQLQWSISIRDEVSRLHRNLEGHKSAITIAIAATSMSMTRGIKSDTSSIRSKAARIPQIQQQLAAFLEALQIEPLDDDGVSEATQLGVVMQRFLEETYSGSVNGSVVRRNTFRSQTNAPSVFNNLYEEQQPLVDVTFIEKSFHKHTDILRAKSPDALPEIPSSATLTAPLSHDEYLTSLTKSFSDSTLVSSTLSQPIQNQHDSWKELSFPLRHPHTQDSGTETKVARRKRLRSWIQASKNPPIKTNPPKPAPPETTTHISEALLREIASLLATDPRGFKKDPTYDEYQREAQDLYENTLLKASLAASDQVQVTTTLFEEAVSLHNSGRIALATSKAKSLAENGHTASQIMYALALRYGRGCRCDPKQALAYLYSAARVAITLALNKSKSETGPHYFADNAAGLDELGLALFEIAETFRYTWAEPVSAGDARIFYQAAAKLGDVRAMRELAWCFIEGIGGEISKYAAAQVLRVASAQGHERPIDGWIWKEKYNND